MSRAFCCSDVLASSFRTRDALLRSWLTIIPATSTMPKPAIAASFVPIRNSILNIKVFQPPPIPIPDLGGSKVYVRLNVVFPLIAGPGTEVIAEDLPDFGLPVVAYTRQALVNPASPQASATTIMADRDCR